MLPKQKNENIKNHKKVFKNDVFLIAINFFLCFLTLNRVFGEWCISK